MAFRYVVPALAAAGMVAAQCSVGGTTTISASAQASTIGACSTFTGSIAIATGTSDQLDFSPSLQRIRGSLTANNVAMLTSLEADALTTIDSSLTLVDCPALNNVNFPQLTSVDNIHWVGLATLQGLSFTTGVQMASTVLIENTQLGSLEGINLQMVDSMELSNNRYLQSINMQIANITNELIVVANGRDVDLSLPNLISANNLIIQNVSTINVASLESVNGTFGFYSNFVDSLSCPNLTSIGHTLAIDDNAQLTAVSFPELKTITGGMQIQNNTHYSNATGFPKLQTVGGAVALYGVFDSVPLPALKEVRGAFDIVSSSNSKTLASQCTHYMSIHGSNNVIQGSGFDCNPNLNGASTKGHGTATTGSSPSGSSSATPSTSSSAANSLLISGTTGVLGVVAAVFGML